MPDYSLEDMWLIGILEGEGSFGTNGRSKTPLLRVGMTDKDTMRRVEKAMPGGYWYINKGRTLKSGRKGKDQYMYHLSGQLAAETMVYIYPQMCKRRQEQINKILEDASDIRYRKVS